MSKEHIQEAALVDLSDDALKEVIGATYTRLKTLEEQVKTHPEVQRLAEEIAKLLHPLRYKIRACKARLKASRYVANARGLQWRDPAAEESNDEVS